MVWEANLIIWLQTISGTAFDYFVYALTLFGDQIFFTLVLLVIYWCIDKDYGFKFFNVYIMGCCVLEISKTIFRRPRPYVAYRDKIKSIIKDTGGYSFPSGHSQSIANISTQLSLYAKKKRFFKTVIVLSVIISLSVMISRMFLGQHFFTDVLVGALFGIGLAILFGFVYELISAYRYKFYYVILPVSVLITIILLLINSGSEFSNIIKICGVYGGFSWGYFLENKFVRYEIKADKFYKYILRFLLGVAIALFLKETLNLLFGLLPLGWLYNILNSYIRYFILVIWMSFVAPLVFAKLHI